MHTLHTMVVFDKLKNTVPEACQGHNDDLTLVCVSQIPVLSLDVFSHITQKLDTHKNTKVTITYTHTHTRRPCYSERLTPPKDIKEAVFFNNVSIDL